jgi:hypothetical protein
MDDTKNKESRAADIEISELIEALNDPKKAEILMRERGWTESELIARAEEITRNLSQGVASVNCV